MFYIQKIINFDRNKRQWLYFFGSLLITKIAIATNLPV
jgi:hypothetical protein